MKNFKQYLKEAKHLYAAKGYDNQAEFDDEKMEITYYYKGKKDGVMKVKSKEQAEKMLKRYNKVNESELEVDDEKLSLKESDLDYEDLVEELREKSAEIKTWIDKIYNRFNYRMMVNRSYPKPEANKIQDQVWNEFDKAEKIIEKCWNKIG